MNDGDGSFLSRWSRRKAAVREGKPVPEDPAQVQAAQPPSSAVRLADAANPIPAPVPTPTPMPTLADVAVLRPGDNIARFVAQGVDESVKRAALKTLFADPHFNVMDGLDTYIDDYSKPDPIPLEILRKLRQSETLGLFDPVEAPAQPEMAGDEVAAPQSPESESGQEPRAAANEDPAPAPESADDPAADKHA